MWIDDAVYIAMGQGTRKGKNLAFNAHCPIAMAFDGLDLVIEGPAARVADQNKLQKAAAAYRESGWPVTVLPCGFDAPFRVPTTGPTPFDVYELSPSIAFGFDTTEGAVNWSTRWRFFRD